MTKPVKVLYDHQIFTSQEYGGISRLFVELLKKYKNSEDIDAKLSLLLSNNHYLSELGFNSKFFPNTKIPGKRKIMGAINYMNSVRNLLKGDYDIFHPTYYDSYFLPFLKEKPFVLSVHDMTHKLFPEMMSKNDRTSEFQEQIIPKAEEILTISENTKRDILRFFNVDSQKIQVVPLATSLIPLDKEIDMKLPDKYILFVGVRRGHKNFDKFFEGVFNLLKNDKDLYLVCGGGKDFSEPEIKIFDKSGVTNQVIYVPFANNDELATLYQNAILFVFPSLYEGFGIPVLEAFSCNCPAVVSNASSFPEIAKDAVVYFDPNDSDSIRASVERVLKDTALQTLLRIKGTQRGKDFSWEKTTQATAKVYKDIKF